MSDSTLIKSRLNRALCVFVSVPLSALPVAAQDKLPGGRLGVRKLGVRAIKGAEVRVPGIRANWGTLPGIRKIQDRVPKSVGERLPDTGIGK